MTSNTLLTSVLSLAAGGYLSLLGTTQTKGFDCIPNPKSQHPAVERPPAYKMLPLLSLNRWLSGLWPEGTDAEGVTSGHSAYSTDLRVEENLESLTIPYVALDLDTKPPKFLGRESVRG